MGILIDVAILYLVMITVTSDLRFRFLDFALWAVFTMLITGIVVSFVVGLLPEGTSRALLVAVGTVIDTLAVLGLLWFKFQIDNWRTLGKILVGFLVVRFTVFFLIWNLPMVLLHGGKG